MMTSDRAGDERYRGTTRVGIAFCSVMVLAVIVRGAVSAAMLSSLSADPDAYRAIADVLASSGVFGLGESRPTAFRPPLYPAVLAITSTANVAVAVLHVVLGVITTGLTFASTQTLVRQTAASVLASVIASVIASVLVIVDPILVQQSTLVMTETLAVAIVAAAFYVWTIAARDGFSIGRCVWLGGLLSLAYLCRPTFLVWAGFLVLALIVVAIGRRKFLPPIIVGGLLASTMAIWMARNVAAVGHPVWATTHGGYTLLLANNPDVFDHLRDGRPIEDWNPQAFFDAYDHRYAGDPSTDEFWRRDWSSAGPPNYPDDAGEVNDDRYVGAAAKALIARRPDTFAWACLCRCKFLWTPFPARVATGSAVTSNLIGAYYLVVYAAAIVGAWRWRRKSAMAWVPIAAMVVTLTLVHAVYWSNMRMRAPAMPLVAILAAAGLVSMKQRKAIDVADG